MNALHLAEQAALGALMLDPPLATQVTTWMRADDFQHPWHAEVYTVIRELTAARTPCVPRLVAPALTDRVGSTQADLPRIVDLLQAAGSASAGRHYAAMVLDGSLRRQTAGYGVLLKGAALTSSATGSAAAVFAVCAQVDAAVDAGAHRWALATTADHPATIAAARDDTEQLRPVAPVATSVGADRMLTRHPLPAPDEVADHEAQLITALIGQPSHLEQVADWLDPHQVTSATWRPVYEALLSLHATGTPIDAVTVAWQTHRTAATHGPGPATRDLRDAVTHATALDVPHVARLVAGDHLRLTADTAARALLVDTANPGLTITDLLGTARLITQTLRAAAVPVERHTPQPVPAIASQSADRSRGRARLTVVAR